MGAKKSGVTAYMGPHVVLSLTEARAVRDLLATGATFDQAALDRVVAKVDKADTMDDYFTETPE